MGIFSIIGGAAKAVTGLVTGVGDAVDKLSTTEEEKLTLRNELQVLVMDFQGQIAQLAAEAHAEQAQTVRAEIQSKHWLAANWRPILALTFGAIVVYAAVFVSAFGFPPVDMSAVPGRFWTLLTTMVSGYTVLRSAEKIIPQTKLAK